MTFGIWSLLGISISEQGRGQGRAVFGPRREAKSGGVGPDRVVTLMVHSVCTTWTSVHKVGRDRDVSKECFLGGIPWSANRPCQCPFLFFLLSHFDNNDLHGSWWRSSQQIAVELNARPRDATIDFTVSYCSRNRVCLCACPFSGIGTLKPWKGQW